MNKQTIRVIHTCSIPEIKSEKAKTYKCIVILRHVDTSTALCVFPPKDLSNYEEFVIFLKATGRVPSWRGLHPMLFFFFFLYLFLSVIFIWKLINFAKWIFPFLEGRKLEKCCLTKNPNNHSLCLLYIYLRRKVTYFSKVVRFCHVIEI